MHFEHRKVKYIIENALDRRISLPLPSTKLRHIYMQKVHAPFFDMACLMPSHKIKFYLALVRRGKNIIHGRYVTEKDLHIQYMYVAHRHTCHIKLLIFIRLNFVRYALSSLSVRRSICYRNFNLFIISKKAT
jgi:hypothetical protein